MDWNGILGAALAWVLPVLFAVTLHEAAHGFAAWRLGDDTARALGRLSLNPIKHIDLFGTVLLPAGLLYLSGGNLLFGFAKPVPVNFNRLGKPGRDMALVAAAGPLANLLLALLSAALFHVLPLISKDLRQLIGYNLANSVWINMVLCLFNLLPIPPLDGGRIAVSVLPRMLASKLARLEKFGIAIILGAMFLLPWAGSRLGLDLDLLWRLIGIPAEYMSNAIFKLAGVK